MKIKREMIKYFILLILLQSCFGIEFHNIINDIYSEFKLKHGFNENDKDENNNNNNELPNIQKINLPSSMLTLFDDKIKDNFLNYALNMKNMMSLVFSCNQNLLMEELKQIIFEEVPNAEKGFDFLNPKIQKFEISIEKFYKGGSLNSFNDYYKYIDIRNIPLNVKAEELFEQESCHEQNERLQNSITFPRIFDKLKHAFEQYNEEGKYI